MKPVTHVVITPLRILGWRGGGSEVKRAKPRKYLLDTKQNKQAGKVSSTMGFLSAWVVVVGQVLSVSCPQGNTCQLP